MEQTQQFSDFLIKLAGDKLISSFITEVWSSASPEAKKELANSIIARLKYEVEKANSWDFRDHFIRIVRIEVGKIIEKEFKPEEFAQRVVEQLKIVSDEEIKRAVSQTIDDAKRAILEKIAFEVRAKR